MTKRINSPRVHRVKPVVVIIVTKKESSTEILQSIPGLNAKPPNFVVFIYTMMHFLSFFFSLFLTLSLSLSLLEGLEHPFLKMANCTRNCRLRTTFTHFSPTSPTPANRRMKLPIYSYPSYMLYVLSHRTLE